MIPRLFEIVLGMLNIGSACFEPLRVKHVLASCSVFEHIRVVDVKYRENERSVS